MFLFRCFLVAIIAIIAVFSENLFSFTAIKNSLSSTSTADDSSRRRGGRPAAKANFTSIVSDPFEGYLVGKFSGWNVMIFDQNQFCPILTKYVKNATELKNASRGTELRGGGNYSGRVLIRVEHNCQALFNHPNYGQGNWITSFYSNRYNALFASDQVDFMALCTDGEEKKRELVLPWIMGYWPSQQFALGNATPNSHGHHNHHDPKFPWPYPQPPKRDIKQPSEAKCGGGSLVAMVPYIIHDLRRMAVAVYGGIPSPSHPSASWADKYLFSARTAPLKLGPDVPQLFGPKKGDEALFPDIGQPDDAALHFRCGDLFGSGHPGFGFMNYKAYANRISPSAESIGIITSPYGNGGQNRPGTESRGPVKNACRKVVEGLRDYLKEKFPAARVSVWNGPNETVVTSYARLIMANQTVVGMGSFGVFPALASFGRGYIRNPDFKKVANHWVKGVPEMYDHVELFNAPERLMAGTASKMQRQGKWDELFKFFRGA